MEIRPALIWIAAALGGSLTASADPGATLRVLFQGTGIRVLYSRGPEGGFFSGWVDAGPLHTAEGYGESYSYGYVLAFEGLPAGDHALTVTNGDGAIWIEAVQVQGVLVEPPPMLTPIVPTPSSQAGASEPHTEVNPLVSALEASVPVDDYVVLEAATVADLTDLILYRVNLYPELHHLIRLTSATYTVTEAHSAGTIEYSAMPVLGIVTIVGNYGLDENGNSLTPDQITTWNMIERSPTAPVIDLFHIAAGGRLTLYNVRLVNGGGASRMSGGAIVNDGELYLYNSQIVNNNSNFWGGGIHNAGTLVAINTEFIGNNAVDTVNYIGGGGSAIINYGSLEAYCSTFQNNRVSPTIQGGSIYVPFTVPGGAIYNESPNISVHYSNFIGNTADGQNPNCSHWPQYGYYSVSMVLMHRFSGTKRNFVFLCLRFRLTEYYCPLHIRDFASTVPADASNNYWSQLDSKATWGSVTTAPVLSAPVSYGELSGEGDVCFVPPPPSPPRCAITINEEATLYTFEYGPDGWPLPLKVYLDEHVHDPGFDLNLLINEQNIRANIDGYSGEYHIQADMTNLEVDSFYLQRSFNIAHIRRAYFVEDQENRDVDFWIYTGDGVSPHPDNPDPLCFEALPVVPDRPHAIDLLAEYGVGIAEDGQAWTDTELRAILTGVMRVGEAYVQAGVMGTTPQQCFQTVMGLEMIFLRLAETYPGNSEWGRYYSDAPDPFEGGLDSGYCSNFGPMSGVHPRVVACRGRLLNDEALPPIAGEISEFTAVHELGHLFDSSIGDELFPRMEIPRGQIVISDCNDPQSTVMGTYRGKWTRGSRGWGSTGPAQGFSDFQQNPFPQDDPSGDLKEAAADMYLNWVYRITSDETPGMDCSIPAEVGTWQGFRNIKADGTEDIELGRYPGNKRYMWMNEVILDLLPAGSGSQ